MTGYEFENYCAEYLERNGFNDIEVTQSSGDQGIDIIAWKKGIKYGIQCKYYSSSIGNDAVQQAFAGARFYDCDVAAIMSNSTFTPSATQLANKTKVKLWSIEVDDNTDADEIYYNEYAPVEYSPEELCSLDRAFKEYDSSNKGNLSKRVAPFLQKMGYVLYGEEQVLACKENEFWYVVEFTEKTAPWACRGVKLMVEKINRERKILKGAIIVSTAPFNQDMRDLAEFYGFKLFCFPAMAPSNFKSLIGPRIDSSRSEKDKKVLEEMFWEDREERNEQLVFFCKIEKYFKNLGFKTCASDDAYYFHYIKAERNGITYFFKEFKSSYRAGAVQVFALSPGVRGSDYAIMVSFSNYEHEVYEAAKQYKVSLLNLRLEDQKW